MNEPAPPAEVGSSEGLGLTERLRQGWPYRGADARLLCEEAAAELERLHAALHELVLLEDKRLRAEALAYGGFKCAMSGYSVEWEPKKHEHDSLTAELRQRLPAAWSAARTALRRA